MDIDFDNLAFNIAAGTALTGYVSLIGLTIFEYLYF